MRRKPGDRVTSIILPSIDGAAFDTDSLQGRRYMLSFLRFAGCPFCNLRVHNLVSHFNEFGSDFTIVAVFDAPLDDLVRHATRHKAPFPILADEDNEYYREYGIEHSIPGMLKAIVMRMPTLMKAMFKGYLPTTIKGSMTTMPADLLVDEQGAIRVVHYGEDEGDHLAIETVRDFSTGFPPAPE